MTSPDGDPTLNAVAYVRRAHDLSVRDVARLLGTKVEAVRAMEAYGRLPLPLARWVLRILPPGSKRHALAALGYSSSRAPRRM